MTDNGPNQILTRSIGKVLPSKEELEKALNERILSIYHGIDPTGPDLHLGHLSTLLVVKRFAKLGHEVTILFGDFTARIGDPSGKDAARKQLSEEEVKNNLGTYKDQLRRVFGNEFGKIKFAHNSKWLSKLKFGDIINLASRVTVQQMLERDMFKRRLENQSPIGLHEFLYPLMQGYDSYALRADVEIGGSDQLFNMMTGRAIEADLTRGEKSKFVITVKLLEDPGTGKKMGKSEGWYVSLNVGPNDMFGKIMRLPDSIVPLCFELCTEVPVNEINNLLSSTVHPRDLKSRLAFEIVKMLYGEKEADRAKEEFDKVFVEGKLPEDVEEIKIKESRNILDVLTEAGLAPSKSEARRLVDSRAVELDGEIVGDWDLKIDPNKHKILRVGKHRFVKITR